jgi:hypothetical protein
MEPDTSVDTRQGFLPIIAMQIQEPPNITGRPGASCSIATDATLYRVRSTCITLRYLRRCV